MVEATCRPYRTLSEPTKGRKAPEKRLVDLLIQHYDELERLIAKGQGRVDDRVAAQRGTSPSVERRASGETTVPTILARERSHFV